MEHVGIDLITEAIKDALVIIPDVRAAKESGGKITWGEGAVLVVKHGTKAVRFISHIDEFGKQIIDIDPQESEQIFDQLKDQFGGSEKAKEAIKKIVSGVASVSQGTQELIELKKDENTQS